MLVYALRFICSQSQPDGYIPHISLEFNTCNKGVYEFICQVKL